MCYHRCETYIVFANVKLRTLLTLYGLAHTVLLQETLDFQHNAEVL